MKLNDLTPQQIKIYRSISGAKDRCTSTKHRLYKRYGGRGIKYLLEENKTRLQVVAEQTDAYLKAMKKCPNERISINRIDNNGHYTEDNIEWVSVSENARQGCVDNKNNSKLIAARSRNGKRVGALKKKSVKCLVTGKEYESVAEAERKTGIDSATISKCCRGKRKSAGKTSDGRKMVWEYTKK